MVIYERQGKPLKKGSEIPGPFKLRTVGYDNPRAGKLVPVRRGAEACRIGEYFAALERPRRIGHGFFAKASEEGTEGKLASRAVAVRFFVARHNKCGTFVNKPYQGLRNR
jgi:hypothetical protein